MNTQKEKIIELIKEARFEIIYPGEDEILADKIIASLSTDESKGPISELAMYPRNVAQSSPLPVSEEKTAEILMCVKELKKALTLISEWNLPESGLFWDKEQKDPMSYGTAFGSNGERDYFKQVAQTALFIFGGIEESIAQFRSETNEIMDIDKGEKNYTRYGDQLMELWCKCGPTERYKDSIMQGIWYCGHCKKPIHEKD
jgi:hypothetical protein